MARPQKVHMDNSVAGGRIRRALCGWLDVDTVTDPTAVTCAECKRMMRRASEPAAPRTRPVQLGKENAGAVLAETLGSLLGLTAGPPPVLTPALWAASCRGAVDGIGRCGECALCTWERTQARWRWIEPWTVKHKTKRGPDEPRWKTLGAALIDFYNFEAHGRVAPSATGPQLDRCRAGLIFGGKAGSSGKGSDPLMGRADDLVHVDQALWEAYPEGAHTLTHGARVDILLARTGGVHDPMPSEEALAERHGVTPGDIRGLVRTGRRVVEEELLRRGLLARQRPRGGRRAAA